jgi:hypothetical protein
VWYKRRVTLVDLRGREHEPEVRRLLDPRPGWLVVGWSRDERLVACAGLERTSHEELALRALGASDDSEALRCSTPSPQWPRRPASSRAPTNG